MAKRKKVIHLHSNVYANNAPKAPTKGTLEKGEIAVNYNDTEPAIFIENNSGDIVTFNAVRRSEISGINSDISDIVTDIRGIKENNKIKLNGTEKNFSGNTWEFYAPASSGASNNVLISDGANKSPKWVAQSTLHVGTADTLPHSIVIKNNADETIGTFNGSSNVSIKITPGVAGAAEASHSHESKDLPIATTSGTGIVKIGNFLTVDAEGKIEVATGTTANKVAVGNHTHSYAGSASVGGPANSVANKLTIKNYTGGTIADFNGSSATAITLNVDTVGAAEKQHSHLSSDLPIATTAGTGIVKIGNFISVDASGKIQVATGTSSTTVAVGNHTHSYAGSASVGGPASSVANKLTIKNHTGGTIADFNGSAATAITLNVDTVGAAEKQHSHQATDLPIATTAGTGIVKIGNFITVDASGKIEVATGTSSTTVAVGNHTHSYAGSASVGGPASSVANKLTIKNYTGGTIADFNGSAATSITLNVNTVGAAEKNHSHESSDLPIATTAGTGIVKIGNFISVDAGGKIQVATGTSSTTVAVGNHTHSYAGSSSVGGAANSVANKLTIKNHTGGTIVDFNGSSAITVTVDVDTVGAAEKNHSHLISDLPYQTTLSSDNTKLPTGKAVKDYVDGLVVSPVNYKGARTNGTLPASGTTQIGDLYIVQTTAISIPSGSSGTGAAQTAETGDYIIARTKSTWDVIQKNMNGAVTAAEDLTSEYIVVGNGAQTVKKSSKKVTDFAESSHQHSGGDITSAVANATNAGNADTVDNYHIKVVSAIPSTPDANTIYILK